MTYLLASESRHGNKAIDLPRFATDLANELGAMVLPCDHPMENQKVLLGDANMLRLTANNWKRHVTVGIEPTDVPLMERWSAKTKSATVDPEKRSIAAIAKDIKRRVIEASLPGLMECRKALNDKKDRATKVGAWVYDVRREFPSLSVKYENGETATVYLNNNGVYLNARIESYGVAVDRIGSISVKKFCKLMKALTEEEDDA